MPGDNEKYQKFLQAQVERLGSFKFDPETLLWNYTNGSGCWVSCHRERSIPPKYLVPMTTLARRRIQRKVNLIQ